MPRTKSEASNKTGGPSNKTGRPSNNPAHEPTRQTRDMVTVMVAGAIDQNAIAAAMGISRPTLRKHYRQEIKNGTTTVNGIVLVEHLKRIKAGDFAAIKWWEQSRMAWAETQKIQPLDKDGKPADMKVTVELLG